MTEETHTLENAHQETASPSLRRAFARVGLDFVLGLALFAAVAGGLSGGPGQAFAGASGWVTTIAPAVKSDGAWVTLAWPISNRDAAIAILGLSFAAITAFNLSIARHLRATAAPALKVRDPATD